MKRLLLLLVLAATHLLRGETEDGFTSLFDGKTFDGWKPAEVNKETWKIEDGAFVTRGKTCHLFYVGDDGKVPVGATRHSLDAPPRSTVIRCLRPDGDIFYLRHTPDPKLKPIVLLHCPVF